MKISIFGGEYVKKKVNKIKKPFYKKWWFWVIIVIILAGAFGDSDSGTSSSKRTSSHSSIQSSKIVKTKTTTNQWQKIKAENLKIGTSKEEVIKKLGKPIDDSDGLLTYHGFDLYFENNKLVGGNLPKLQKKAYKAGQERKQSEKNKQQEIQNFAQSFGQKPVEEVQKEKMVYPSQRVGNQMMYSWRPDKDMPTYIRVDDENGFTTVYLYDQNAKNGLGQQLYQGKTIMQKNKQPVIVY